MFDLFVNIGRIGGEGLGPFSAVGDFANAVSLLNKILSNVIGFLTIVGGLYFMFQFIIGAYGWISAGGNRESLKSAQDKITHAIIGLTLIVAAYAIVSVIGSLLGLQILNPGAILEKIKP